MEMKAGFVVAYKRSDHRIENGLSSVCATRLNPSLWRLLCWTHGKGERYLRISTWTSTMRLCVRCSAAAVTGRAAQGLEPEARRTASALLLRRSQETATLAQIWSSGFAFPNRYTTPTVALLLCTWTRMTLIEHNSVQTGHLLSDQPPHRHSDGGKSGKGSNGKYYLWDWTLHQEHRLQQGQ